MDVDIQIAESLIEAFDHEETGILLWDKNDKLGIASLFNTLGFTYYQLKEYEIAAYYYKIALTVTPDYVTSLSNLAYLYQSQNQIDNLQPIYKQLAVLDPNSEKTAEINNYLSKRLKNSE